MAAGSTYSPIATYTVSGSSQRGFTFSSIPSTYTDLVLIVRGSAGAGANCYVQFNSDTGSNYSMTYISGNGSGTESGRNTSSTGAYVGAFYSNSNLILNVMNYANTTTYKSFLVRNGDAGNFARTSIDMWRSTSAINTLYIFANENNFDIGTTATLYGITAA